MTELELPVEALLELRAADAPLRLLREKLPLSAKLLKQARADARPRVRASMGQTKLVSALLSWRGRRRPALEEQRTQLAMTCALLDRQFERLGNVQQLLLRDGDAEGVPDSESRAVALPEKGALGVPLTRAEPLAVRAPLALAVS